MGEEHRGRVRGMGLTVTPSSVATSMRHEQGYGELKRENLEMKQEIKEIKQMMEQLIRQQGSSLEVCDDSNIQS